VKLLALVLLVTTMLGAGLQVDVKRFGVLLRNYGLLIRALLVNFVLVPGFAVLVVRTLHAGEFVSIGIVLMALAPGVPFLVNSAGRKQGGSMTFALAISFCFTAISVVTIPLTAALVLPGGSSFAIDGPAFFMKLGLFQLLPLVAGALIATRLAPATSEKLAKGLGLVFLVAAVALLVTILPKLVQYVSSLVGFGHLWIIALVALFSGASGWLFGGPDIAYRRTLSIATLMRNVGICASIGAGETFANTLVLPTIATYFVVSFVISIPARILYARTKETPA